MNRVEQQLEAIGKLVVTGILVVGRVVAIGILVIGTSAVVQRLAGRSFTIDRIRVGRNFVMAVRIITRITPAVVSKLVVGHKLVK